MPYREFMEGLHWSISLALRGHGARHPSRRTSGLDEAKASFLASEAIEQLRLSGYVLGHREHPVAKWINGRSDITVAPRAEAPQPSTDRTGAKEE